MHAGMPSLYADEPLAVEEGDKPALRPTEPKVHNLLQRLPSHLCYVTRCQGHHALLASALQACGASFYLLCVGNFHLRLVTCKQDVMQKLDTSIHEDGRQDDRPLLFTVEGPTHMEIQK